MKKSGSMLLPLLSSLYLVSPRMCWNMITIDAMPRRPPWLSMSTLTPPPPGRGDGGGAAAAAAFPPSAAPAGAGPAPAPRVSPFDASSAAIRSGSRIPVAIGRGPHLQGPTQTARRRPGPETRGRSASPKDDDDDDDDDDEGLPAPEMRERPMLRTERPGPGDDEGHDACHAIDSVPRLRRFP